MRKRNIYKLIVLFIFITGHSLADVKGQKEKVINKSYPVTNKTQLSVYNKFGKVHIDTWDKMEIKVDVKIIVKKENDSKAQEILDGINIEIEQNGKEEIQFQTQFPKNASYAKKEAVEVNYTISMPKSNPLAVSNKYGPLYLADHEGEVALEVKYGEMKLERLNEAAIELKFGSGSIKYIEEAQLEIHYSKITIGQINEAVIESHYSDLEIDKANELVLESKYGNANIGELRAMHTDIGYSGLTIGKLEKELLMESKYAPKIVIGAVAKDFDQIKIENKYSVIKMKLAPGTNANIEGAFKYSDFDYPESSQWQEKEKEHTSSYYMGYIGSKEGNSQIELESTYGDISIALEE